MRAYPGILLHKLTLHRFENDADTFGWLGKSIHRSTPPSILKVTIQDQVLQIEALTLFPQETRHRLGRSIDSKPPGQAYLQPNPYEMSFTVP